VKIVIADPHRIFADALARLLCLAHHEIGGYAVELECAAAAVAREQADACVLDLDLPGMSEPGAIRHIISGAPRTAFIVLAASAGSGDLARVVDAGVHGFALKSDDFVEFLRVLTSASSRAARYPAGRPAGTTVLSLSAQALRADRRPQRAEELSRLLTGREREVLTRLVRGEGTTTMARSMGVRLSTARTHVDSVLIKLGVHSRLEAVAYAVREGLVSIDGSGAFGNWNDGEQHVLSG